MWPLEEQNRQYVRDMKAARDGVNSLFEKGIAFIAQPTRFDNVTVKPAKKQTVVVYNGSSWDRTYVVQLASPRPNSRIESIRDLTTGGQVNFDVAADGSVVFIARDVPANGYSSYEVRTAAGKAVPTLRNSSGTSISSRRYSIRLRPDGNIESIRDLKENREVVNNNGERPFNDLLRTEGSDASVVAYPVTPQISVERGQIISRITIHRERSIFPLTTITIYEGIDRVEIHNELDPKYEGFQGGNNNWNDSYYFSFPFNVSKNGLQVLRGGQKWFDRLPEDYLPG